MFFRQILMFAYGLGSNLHINLVGRLLYNEALAFILFPFINLKRLFSATRILYFISPLFFLLIIQVVSDIYNSTDSINYLKGLALIIFSIISALYLSNYLLITRRGFETYLIGLVISGLLFKGEGLDLSVLETNSNYFKVGILPFLQPIILLLVYLAFKDGKKKLVLLIMVMFTLTCFFFDARSTGLIYFIATFFFARWKSQKLKLRKLSILLVALTVLFYTGYVFYVDAVKQGFIKGLNSSTQISRLENPYNPFEYLKVGRSHFFVAVEAIKERPLLGYGSWAEDPNDKYSLLAAEMNDSDRVVYFGFIPSHSILLAGWLYSGIFGFLLLLVLAVRIFTSIGRLYVNGTYTALLPIILILGVQFIWDLLFSPIGHLRITVPLLIALLTTLSKKDGKKHLLYYDR